MFCFGKSLIILNDRHEFSSILFYFLHFSERLVYPEQRQLRMRSAVTVRRIMQQFLADINTGTKLLLLLLQTIKMLCKGFVKRRFLIQDLTDVFQRQIKPAQKLDCL